MMFGVNGPLIDEIVQILSSNVKVNKAVVFGSRARGDYQKSSDLDIALFAVPSLSSQELNRLRHEIEELNTIIKIDLLDVDRVAKAPLLENILSEGITIYDKSANGPRKE